MRSAVVGHRYRADMGSTEEKAKLNQSVMKAITLLRATAEEPNANVSSRMPVIQLSGIMLVCFSARSAPHDRSRMV